MFPMNPTTLFHRHGGKIVRIHGISHREDKPKGGYSRDYWFFDADVEWDDSPGKAHRHEVEPFKLACDDPGNNEELKAAMAAMDDYLRTHGTWSDSKPHQGWYANRENRRAA
jgi:hypothetical protein